MLISTIRLTLTPLATAASSLRPVARNSKPNRLRSITNQNRKPTTTASTIKP